MGRAYPSTGTCLPSLQIQNFAFLAEITDFEKVTKSGADLFLTYNMERKKLCLQTHLEFWGELCVTSKCHHFFPFVDASKGNQNKVQTARIPHKCALPCFLNKS